MDLKFIKRKPNENSSTGSPVAINSCLITDASSRIFRSETRAGPGHTTLVPGFDMNRNYGEVEKVQDIDLTGESYRQFGTLFTSRLEHGLRASWKVPTLDAVQKIQLKHLLEESAIETYGVSRQASQIIAGLQRNSFDGKIVRRSKEGFDFVLADDQSEINNNGYFQNFEPFISVGYLFAITQRYAICRRHYEVGEKTPAKDLDEIFKGEEIQREAHVLDRYDSFDEVVNFAQGSFHLGVEIANRVKGFEDGVPLLVYGITAGKIGIYEHHLHVKKAVSLADVTADQVTAALSALNYQP